MNKLGQGQVLRQSSRLTFGNKEVFCILLLLSWIAFTCLRVRYLGFFSDDWLLLSDTSISPKTLKDYLASNAYSRPTYGLLAWLANSLGHGSPAYWQAFASVTTLIAAVAVNELFKYIYGIAGYSDRATRVGALIGVFALLIAPWQLGVMFWPTGVLTLWSLIFIAFGFLKLQSDRPWQRAVGTVSLLAGMLTYEAYWFIFVPLLIMTNDFRVKRIRSSAYLAAVCVFTLSFVIFYQRFVLKYFLGTHPKRFDPDNIGLIIHNLIGLKRVITEAIMPVPWNVLFFAVVLCVFLAWKTGAVSLRRLTTLACAVSAGLFLSAVMYGLVGYGIAGTGVMSRTMAVPSLYFASAIGMFAAAAVEATNEGGRRAGYFLYLLSLSAVVGVMLVGFVARTYKWVQIQEQSTKVLHGVAAVLDAEYAKAITTDSLVVVVDIKGDPFGDIFGASYELSGGMALFYPGLVNEQVSFLPARVGAWQTIWDGEKVVQRWCHSPQGTVLSTKPSVLPPVFIRIDPNSGRTLEKGTLARFTAYGCNGRFVLID